MNLLHAFNVAFKGYYLTAVLLLVSIYGGCRIRNIYFGSVLTMEDGDASTLWFYDFAADFFTYILADAVMNYVWDEMLSRLSNHLNILKILAMPDVRSDKGKKYYTELHVDRTLSRAMMFPFQFCWLFLIVGTILPFKLICLAVVWICFTGLIAYFLRTWLRPKKVYDETKSEHYPKNNFGEKDSDYALTTVSASAAFQVVNGCRFKLEDLAKNWVAKKEAFVEQVATIVSTILIGVVVKQYIGLTRIELIKYMFVSGFVDHLKTNLVDTYVGWYSIVQYWSHCEIMEQTTRDNDDILAQLSYVSDDETVEPYEHASVAGNITLQYNKEPFVVGSAVIPHSEVQFNYESGLHYILAGNGLGKTLFLRCLWMDMSVRWCGEQRSTSWLLKHVAYLQQTLTHIPFEEAVVMNRKNKFPELVAALGLEEITTSGSTGETRKMNFFMTITSAASFIILDEPFANVDPPGRAVMITVLRRTIRMAQICHRDRCIILCDNTDFLHPQRPNNFHTIRTFPAPTIITIEPADHEAVEPGLNEMVPLLNN